MKKICSQHSRILKKYVIKIFTQQFNGLKKVSHFNSYVVKSVKILGIKPSDFLPLQLNEASIKESIWLFVNMEAMELSSIANLINNIKNQFWCK